MKKIIDRMRGWLTGLVVLSLMIMTPFQDPQISLASDYVEELQWNQTEMELRDSNDLEWNLEDIASGLEDVPASPEELLSASARVVPMAEVSDVQEETPVTSEGASVKEAPVYREKKSLLPQWRIEITLEQLDLLERCVMAEGGGESYECQVAIACVIINRVLSDKYPDTVDQVIKQKGQFSTWPKMIQKAVVTDQVRLAVREALASGNLPEDVLYFRANRYHRWGKRYCRLDNTYFSTP